eukprot:CAMPEP_0168519052 /NCGR_PEP_ID=MMETSP0405-20121227/7086_1 /TAXON_ID=498012 /ORGANISM="Trichosphaerium sp, Strain Am-I-7 wt" /LENGTH=261 /DNA_ID=CAMNT_0008539517 /DNA_START=337 /DNA_END=1122 /DNA_ORIENTATION=-
MNLKLSKENKALAKTIPKHDKTHTLSKEIASAIQTMSKDPAWTAALARASEYQLYDSAEYFINDLQRLASSDYEPTDNDIIRSRQRTSGVVETRFEVDGIEINLVDVGGQRTERRKWMDHFEGVTAVIFCAALSGYDMMLREHKKVNRMHEALDLFESVCNNRWFTETHMILFLNKNDIFKHKVEELKIPLSTCFSDYDRRCDYDTAVAFIKEKFLIRNKNPNKIVYPHVTNATDTRNITVVFKAVKGIIMHDALHRNGLM